MEKLELDFMRLDGSTPVGERQELINSFNSSKTINVFLLSTRAGMLLNVRDCNSCHMCASLLHGPLPLRARSPALLPTFPGGLGINLTAADTVILHDLDFNPIHDRQAEDRCHRIGQTRPVSVYKMVAAGTVDEKILTKAEKKTEVNSALLDGSSSAGSSKGGGQGDGLSSVSGILADALRTYLN